MHSARFYISLGIYYGYAYEVKRFLRAEIEHFFSSIGTNISQCDIRQSNGCKYHLFITIVFPTSLAKSQWTNSIDPVSGTTINGKWKIHHYVTRRERQQQLNNGFYEDSYDIGDVDNYTSTENVFEEVNDDKIQVVEEKDDSNDEYESIYKWLITPQQTQLQREIAEIIETCKWLATPYWERNKAHAQI
jgi:hypothetical protein